MTWEQATFETTPREITPAILEFCATLDATTRPLLVPLRAEDHCVQAECFFNVMEKVEKDGGEVRYGWAIWENFGVLLVAEFHAVWGAPNGDLIDITPKADGEQTLLFLPDSNRVYEFKPVPSVVSPLLDSEPVVAWARLFRRRLEIELTTFRGPARKGVPAIDLDRLTPRGVAEYRAAMTETMAVAGPYGEISARMKGARLSIQLWSP